eukprot:CAMPEP_0202397814 /NCGR_PEP_ID=MMETSP1128-20130828/860_1 /ASSEMBLY_ACC=CAM_ASM_000463 /TAXON_ID=3047 /ORGANISM="Dunaliella tertiolecta, Strain CCMP1320" /LENGTH=96 /DNA_ID=CAMNT_0049000825 /DNA_START=653 /DNA_END=943 /DNA_ORIENTATION=-
MVSQQMVRRQDIELWSACCSIGFGHILALIEQVREGEPMLFCLCCHLLWAILWMCDNAIGRDSHNLESFRLVLGSNLHDGLSEMQHKGTVVADEHY